MNKGPVMGTAKQLTFPLPLLSMAYQQLIHGIKVKNEKSVFFAVLMTILLVLYLFSGTSHACKDNHVASPIKVYCSHQWCMLNNISTG